MKPDIKVQVTPLRLAALLVIDTQISQLEIGHGQLVALKLLAEAQALADAAVLLAKRKEELLVGWSRSIQLATPADVPPVEPVISSLAK